MPVFCGNSNTEEGDEIVNIAWDEIIVIVMEENNDIFLVVDYALVYLVRGGYRVRQVRQLTYFSFNRHNDMCLENASNKCPLGNCDNKYRRIDHSLGLSLRSSAS